MNYIEFESISKEWNKKICIFGVGLIGRTWGYEVAKAAGFKIDAFCDNNLPSNVAIRDSIKTISLEELYSYGESVLILLTVKELYQKEIKSQLLENGIKNIVEMGDTFGQELYFSIEDANDKQLFRKYEMFMDDSEYLKQRFEYIMGYPLDLRHPQTFNEKLNWLKIYDRKPEYTKMVDKSLVKQYVASIIGDKYIIPTYGVWDSFDEICFEQLPSQFVLKTTHDSGGIVICKNKESFDKKAAKEKLSNSMKYNYYLAGREWPYRNVKPRILAEKYLVSMENTKNKISGILDYKVHCFDGEPRFIQVIGNRDYKNHTGYQLIYDFDWKVQMWSFGDYPRYEISIPIPKNLNEMYECSRILASEKEYVRIDWYEVENQLKFGEITMIPNSGYYLFNDDWTKEVDLELGKLISLTL